MIIQWNNIKERGREKGTERDEDKKKIIRRKRRKGEQKRRRRKVEGRGGRESRMVNNLQLVVFIQFLKIVSSFKKVFLKISKFSTKYLIDDKICHFIFQNTENNYKIFSTLVSYDFLIQVEQTRVNVISHFFSIFKVEPVSKKGTTKFCHFPAA